MYGASDGLTHLQPEGEALDDLRVESRVLRQLWVDK
jgi:hypothetical protein